MARPLSQEARTKTLAAAQDLLQTAGVEGFNVDEVVRRSGVAKSTIYRHFASSDDLIISALDGMMVKYPTPDTGSLRGDLTAFIDSRMELFGDSSFQHILRGIHNRAATDVNFARLHRDFMSGEMAPIRDIMQRAQRRGEVHKDIDLDLAGDLIAGPCLIRSQTDSKKFANTTMYNLIDLVVAALLNWEPRLV